MGHLFVRTYVYVDGFNFFYGAVKGTQYKWLDFGKLFRNLLDPSHQILAIKYFTAHVSGKIDPQKPLRQSSYIRALQAHIPEFSVYYGKFKMRESKAFLRDPKDVAILGKKTVTVTKPEEKGSDVNLAVHLLQDAWLNQYDCAVIVSDDSDLAESIKIVKTHLKKTIGLINPTRNRTPKEISKHVTFYKVVRENLLAICQLPDPIPGTSIHKPSSW